MDGLSTWVLGPSVRLVLDGGAKDGPDSEAGPEAAQVADVLSEGQLNGPTLKKQKLGNLDIIRGVGCHTISNRTGVDDFIALFKNTVSKKVKCHGVT